VYGSLEGVGASMIKGLLLLVLTGCASQHRMHWYTYQTGGGEINTAQAPAFPSYCFDGLMRKWIAARCTKIGYKNISEGFIQFWCSEWRDEDTVALNPLRTNDYWLILWNESRQQYARQAPEDTTYECGDATAFLISAERD